MNKEELELIEELIAFMIELNYEDNMGNNENFKIVNSAIERIKEKLLKITKEDE